MSKYTHDRTQRADCSELRCSEWNTCTAEKEGHSDENE